MRGGRWSLIVALFVAFVALLSPLAPVVATELPGHGVNPADMDRAIDPAVDFYRYANGGWLDRTSLAPESPGIQTISDLDNRTRGQVLDLLGRRVASGDVRPGSDEGKAIRLFEQGIDLPTRNAQGLDPIRPVLDEIAAIDDLAELHRFLQGSVFLSVPGLFVVSAAPDLENSAETAAYLGGPTLGLPNRDYYLEEDAATEAVRGAYVATAAELLVLGGDEATAARTAARAVYGFEAELARATLTREETQDPSLVYNPTAVADLAVAYPLMDWTGYLAGLGLGAVRRLVVVEPRYLAALDAIVRRTPLAVIKDHLRLQLLWSSSANLSEAIETAAFGFYGTALNGVSVQAPILGRTLDQVNRFLGDAVGKLYVEAAFPPAAKAQSTELVREMLDAYRVRLERNPWMTAETKANALTKLDQMRVKVGYPDRWRDYAAVAITDSYFGSALSAFTVWYRQSLAEVGKPVDRDAWPFPPQTVNAFYNPLNNEIVLPAGILQPPLFDVAADPASNFGAIGFVVGHEISHGFDLVGAQFDGEGNLADWWTDEDRVRFEALNDRVAEQYAGIEVIDGVGVDGRLTITENVADLAGIQVAYDAWRRHDPRTGPAVALPADAAGLTEEQRFFVAASSVWRAKIRDEALITQLKVDTHAPAAVRATQPLRNCAAFHAAFGVGPGDPMYLAPAERIVVW